jgi:hypothetical protein
VISDSQLQHLGFTLSATRLWGPAVRVLVTLAAIGLATFQAVTLARVAHTTVTAREMGDFRVFYWSSQHAHDDPYSVAPAAPPGPVWTANLNPPHVVLLFVPLTWFPIGVAFGVWVAASVASAIWAIAIIFKELRIRLTTQSAAWTLLAVLCAAPTGALIFAAQISWILWGPVTFVWAAARRDRWMRAGLAVGLLMSVKPFLALLLLPFDSKPRRRSADIALLVALGCVLAGIIVLGWAPFASWWRALTSVTWAGHVLNASLFGFLDRLFRAQPSVWPLAPVSDRPTLALPFYIVAAAMLLTVSIWSLRARNRPPRHITSEQNTLKVDRSFAVALSAGLLVSPLAWVYYLFFLAGPLVALGRRQVWWRSRLRTAACVIAVVCLSLGPGILASGQPNGWLTMSLGSAYFWAVLILWGCSLEPLESRLTSHAGHST